MEITLHFSIIIKPTSQTLLFVINVYEIIIIFFFTSICQTFMAIRIGLNYIPGRIFTFESHCLTSIRIFRIPCNIKKYTRITSLHIHFAKSLKYPAF